MYGPRMMLGPEVAAPRVACSTSTRRPLRCARTSSGPSAVCSACPSTRVDPSARPVRHLPHRAVLERRRRLGGRRSPRRCAAGTSCASRSPRTPPRPPRAQRYSYTPDLGVFHAVTGLHGDIMIPEDRLKAAVVKAALGETTLLGEIDKLLGKPWDDELRPSATPARAPRSAGCTRWSEHDGPRSAAARSAGSATA